MSCIFTQPAHTSSPTGLSSCEAKRTRFSVVHRCPLDGACTHRHGRHRKVIMQMKFLSIRPSKHSGCLVGGHMSDLLRRKSSKGILYFAGWFRPARVAGGSEPPQRHPLMRVSDRDIVRQSNEDFEEKMAIGYRNCRWLYAHVGWRLTPLSSYRHRWT